MERSSLVSVWGERQGSGCDVGGDGQESKGDTLKRIALAHLRPSCWLTDAASTWVTLKFALVPGLGFSNDHAAPRLDLVGGGLVHSARRGPFSA